MWLGQQNWSSRTFPCWMELSSYFVLPLQTFLFAELHPFGEVFKCQPRADVKSSLVLLEPPDAPEKSSRLKSDQLYDVVLFGAEEQLLLHNSSEPDEHFGRRGNF